MMTEKLVNFLGYSMQGFQVCCRIEGFPRIYNVVTNIDDIINMYKRDNETNVNFKDRNMESN